MSNTARIILVEDDPADARLVLDAFTELHLESQLLILNTGVDALDYLHARGPHRNRFPGLPAAILLDIKLPGMDGFQVLNHIRLDPVLRFIPVIMMTASRQERDLRRAYEAGANAYHVKTIDSDTNNIGLKAVAQFWAVANEPPIGSLQPPLIQIN